MFVRFPDWTEPGSYGVLVLPGLLFIRELNQFGSGLSSAEFEGCAAWFQIHFCGRSEPRQAL